MHTRIIPLSFLLALCGCGSQQPTARIPPNAPSVIHGDCRREHDLAFSQRERDIIAAARRHLEQSDGEPIDAYYHVTQTPEGFEVYVQYIHGYADNGQPWLLPGGFCVVRLREDGSVISVTGGA
jgi:hypothetical protein